MSLCDSCRYQYYVEQLKPCIIRKDDCEFYEKEEAIKMRNATPEEQKSVDDYIKSISKPTGVDFGALEKESSITHIPSYDMDGVFAEIEKFTRLQREDKEKTLAEIITKYDFIVGSKECKFNLMKVLPDGANIICSPYVESPTMIYAIKKFDIMDLLISPQESEDGE